MTVFHLLGHHCRSQHHRHCTRMNQPDITMVTGPTETRSKTHRWTPLSSGTLWPGGSSVTLEQREPCYHRATEDDGGTVKCGPKSAKLPKTKGTEDAQGRQAQVLLEPRTPCPRS